MYGDKAFSGPSYWGGGGEIFFSVHKRRYLNVTAVKVQRRLRFGWVVGFEFVVYAVHSESNDKKTILSELPTFVVSGT